MDRSPQETSYQAWLFDNASYANGKIAIDIVESIVLDEKVDIEIAGSVLKNLNPIGTTNSSQRYRITFENVYFYASYDECLHLDEPSIETDLSVVVRLQSSRLLNWVSTETKVTAFCPDDLQHYCVRTSEFWFHVLSSSEPDISPRDAT